MRIEILCPGKTREKYLEEGIRDYLGRLNRYCPAEIRCLRCPAKTDGVADEVFLARETAILLAALRPPVFLVALDRAGAPVDSMELASLIRRWQGQGIKKLVFLLGGHLGLAPAARQQADHLLSLSAMTFTHEMSRLICLEQLYRALSINAGSAYHN